MKHSHIEGLHAILTKNAESQAVFVFVRGVMAAKPETSIKDAIKMFVSEFGCDSIDPKSAQRQYYRMLPAYMRNKSLFKIQQHDKSNSSGNRPERKLLGGGVGTTASR